MKRRGQSVLVHEVETEEKERHEMTGVVQEQRFETPGEFPKYWAPIHRVTEFTRPWWTVSQTAKRRQPHPGRICVGSLLRVCRLDAVAVCSQGHLEWELRMTCGGRRWLASNVWQREPRSRVLPGWDKMFARIIQAKSDRWSGIINSDGQSPRLF